MVVGRGDVKSSSEVIKSTGDSTGDISIGVILGCARFNGLAVPNISKVVGLGVGVRFMVGSRVIGLTVGIGVIICVGLIVGPDVGVDVGDKTGDISSGFGIDAGAVCSCLGSLDSFGFFCVFCILSIMISCLVWMTILVCI